jgi:hypothetical protein
MKTVKSPWTLVKGPRVAPQNEQCPAASVTGPGSRWSVADGGQCSRRDPTVGVRAQLALQLHEAPDLGAVDPKIGLDVGGRRSDGGEVDAEQLRALVQRGGDGAGQGGIVASQAGMPDRIGEHVFEQQWDELVSTTDPTSTTTR